ncbi:MAG TPA: 50S ribosomal protein L1 [Lacipirellulaceae bacterium]|nr:50S ribosomal protein L1 [Lacipirellulaceae bacterium]
MAVLANSKRMKAAVKKRPAEALSVSDAVAALKKYPAPKFDQTVDIVFRLGVDAAQADQIVRGAIVLPHGIGKQLRVAVFAKGAQADAARAAGADVVGEEDLAQKIMGGWTDFDACIAAPDMMKVVGPLGKVLGPRGLMPSPRAGTVTPDVAKTVGEYKAGKVEFRNDKAGNVHAPVGKLSFEADKLAANVQAFIDRIVSLKPGSVKGMYIKSAHLSAAMSPSVRLAI